MGCVDFVLCCRCLCLLWKNNYKPKNRNQHFVCLSFQLGLWVTWFSKPHSCRLPQYEISARGQALLSLSAVQFLYANGVTGSLEYTSMYFGTKSLCAGVGGRYVFTDQQGCLGATTQGICNMEQALGHLMCSSCATVGLWLTLVPGWLQVSVFPQVGKEQAMGSRKKVLVDVSYRQKFLASSFYFKPSLKQCAGQRHGGQDRTGGSATWPTLLCATSSWQTMLLK